MRPRNTLTFLDAVLAVIVAHLIYDALQAAGRAVGAGS